MDNVTRSGVSAIVEHDYTAKEPDEINLIKGAIIQNIKIQPGGWWEGTLSSGKSGMFPDNFVRVLEPDDKNPVVLREKSSTVNRRCKAVYSYTQNNNDELTLGVGDIIEFLGEVEEGWWRGKLGTRIGVFPSNFVVTVENVSPMLANRRSISGNVSRNRSSLNSSREDLLSTSLEKDAPSLPPKPIRETCKVLFAYAPTNEDELELKEGDIITILTKELPDKGWWKGEIRGRIGVFPDNFVTLITSETSPAKESQNYQKPERPPTAAATTTSKVIINNKTNIRKDSFGSRDSLNDIPNTNVAVYRKSLDNKLIDNKKTITTTTTTTTTSNDLKSYSDLRKSLENLDEKKTTIPPPVLTKKPSVPIKKSPTVGSVTSNLFSGLKQKVKSTDNKLTSQDSFDGSIGSKISNTQYNVTDNNERGIISDRLTKDDSEFDNVERHSILQDMRAGRAKAPKRRPPTTATNSLGETNNVSYVNGISDTGGNVTTANDFTKSLDHNDDDVVKPKPREWGKQKAPWMAELKANQAKKVTPNIDTKSPEINNNSKSIEHETTTTGSTSITNEKYDISKYDMSKSFSTSHVSSSSTSSSSSSSITSSHKKVNESITNNFEIRSSNIDVKNSAHDSLHHKKENDNVMIKSMSSLATKISISDQNKDSGDSNPVANVRPNSVNLRNRSISPLNRLSKNSQLTSTAAVAAVVAAAATAPASTTVTATSTSSATDTIKLANHVYQHQDTNTNHNIPVSSENVCSRVIELEQRVISLEKLVQHQNLIISEILKSVKEESEIVRTLKSALEKYAQCVTQV